MPDRPIRPAIGIVNLGSFCRSHLLSLCGVLSVLKRLLFDELAFKKE
jgi:hypothetical protein